MNKKKIINIVLLFCSHMFFSQTIKGSFPEVKNTEIVLKSLNGFTEKEINRTATDSMGNFILNYPKEYKGAAILNIQNHSSVILLLNKENFEMQWEKLHDFNDLKFSNSKENDLFSEGIKIYQEAEQKLVGLKYLLPLYKNDTTKESWLSNEINKEEKAFDNFIINLPQTSYVKSYIVYRNFLGDLQRTKKIMNELGSIEKYELAFNKINFADDNLWNSGLLKEILTEYYKLLEFYKDKDSIDNKSIVANKVWLKSLEKQPLKLQEVAEFCFNLLESKGLTKASEHIALAILKDDNCTLTDKQTDLFEQYRKLAIGKTAPNIILNSNKKEDLKKLSNKYKLVVFGSSWCPNCENQYPSLVGTYKRLKEKYDLEVVYVSIDTDKNAFEEYYKEAPFITYCDTKGWETKAVKDYHIFATPSYILLDNNLKILAKIIAPEQLEEVLANINL